MKTWARVGQLGAWSSALALAWFGAHRFGFVGFTAALGLWALGALALGEWQDRRRVARRRQLEAQGIYEFDPRSPQFRASTFYVEE